MKNRITFEILMLLLCAVLTITFFPMDAKADIGPKPSVRVLFEELGDELCYGTLLSKGESTGPASVWNGTEEDARYDDVGYDVWKAFIEYEDVDGFHFLQEAWKVSESKELAWTYYPPTVFKILLYFPEMNAFAVSGICERYAFDSYFTVNMESVGIGSVDYDEELSSNERIEANRSYNYWKEVITLIIRIIITIAIEMVIALLFGFKEKKQLTLLAGVNSVTQIILNVLLNVINYRSGEMAFVMSYILLELIVFVIEAFVFCVFLNRISDKQKSKWLVVAYALVANFISFGMGLLISEWLPGIF